jgi:hypothetical protein
LDKAQNTNISMSTKPRICMFSLRNLVRHVAWCADYEFEDLICEVDDAELLAPESHPWFAFGRKLTNQLAHHVSIANLNPGIRKIRLDKSYDVFLAICQSPRDLLFLNAIKGWRQSCRTSVCWLGELWASEFHKYKGHIRILSQFDYVILTLSGTLEKLKKATSASCLFMPSGIDAIKFCPFPNQSHRFIDVYSMGRRSQITHQALLKMSEEGKIFYIYDTVSNMHTFYPRQHRSLLANIAKRSRYFIANAPKIDKHFETQGQSALSYRFFEGAASGTVMIGEPRENEAFRQHFDWPDAVINVPFDSPNIADILAELDAQPERLERARNNNIIQSLLRHDWVYRWKSILNLVGLEPRPALVAREKRLKKLAKDIKKNS